MKLRIVSRAITIKNNKVLLVRNKNQNFWYPPGGAWEYNKENIKETAVREVKEEVGLDIKIKKLQYIQEFHPAPNLIFFEVFWLAFPVKNESTNKKYNNIDSEGEVEEGRWFDREQIRDIRVFPEIMKNEFWSEINENRDLFLGVY
jgi:8-oxo-dGTP diphosphatase